MKVRNDFVTNSSSSSFVLARTGEMNEKQKEEILQYLEKKIFGEKILSPDNTEDEIKKTFEEQYIEGAIQEEARNALKEGKSIYSGFVSFEECEYNYRSFFEDIWAIMEEHGEGDFVGIDDDLRY